MSQSHLVESKQSSRELLRGEFLQVCQDVVVLPDGGQGIREYIVHPGATMVIGMLQDEANGVRIVMERQFRYPIGRVMVELPAGKRDPSESSLGCAQRELREETGYSAAEWAYAGQLHPAIAYSTEYIDIWFARHLTLGERHLDAGEFLDVFTATPAEIGKWCTDGTITDAKTLTGALWLQNVLSGAHLLDWQPGTPVERRL